MTALQNGKDQDPDVLIAVMKNSQEHLSYDKIMGRKERSSFSYHCSYGLTVRTKTKKGT